ncbi:flagellar motor protein MotB [Kerstersia similis]|uniref:flagellar motor protein MotB n=1 Tax=Kerstersia similis TaxID=206505 RepID=UPI0039EE377D
MDLQRPVVRIKSRKRHGKAHHGGSWKIAYADFMTAMMALFLVLWLLGILPEKSRAGLAEYFRMPLRTAVDQGSVLPAQPASPIRGGGRQINDTQAGLQQAPAAAIALVSESEKRDQRRLEVFRHRLNDMIEQNRRLREFKPQLRIDMTAEGLRLQIVDSENRPMFASGSAEVLPHMREILRELAPVFNELPNRISLSGHTDARPFSAGERGYSNWELSTERANASRRELVAGGMQEDKIMRVLGMSASMPLLREDPNADMNRRISLVLLNVATQRRLEAENASAGLAEDGGLQLDAAEAGRAARELEGAVMDDGTFAGSHP